MYYITWHNKFLCELQQHHVQKLHELQSIAMPIELKLNENGMHKLKILPYMIYLFVNLIIHLAANAFKDEKIHKQVKIHTKIH